MPNYSTDTLVKLIDEKNSKIIELSMKIAKLEYTLSIHNISNINEKDNLKKKLLAMKKECQKLTHSLEHIKFKAMQIDIITKEYEKKYSMLYDEIMEELKEV